MKNFKKVLAIILAMAMFFALSMTAFAATTVSTTEDTSLFQLTSSGNTVTYQAVTVDGDGQQNPTVTVYTYCVKTSNTNYATVTFLNPCGYQLYIDDMLFGSSTSMQTNLPKNYRYVVELRDANNNGAVVRTFEVTVVGTNIIHVTLEINCYNAKQWLTNYAATVPNYQNDPAYTAVNSAYNTLSSHVGGFNANGKMTTVFSLYLPSGATAMNALFQAAGNTISISGWYSGNQMTYVTYIDGLGESMCGSMSGWCYVSSTNTSPYYNMPMVGANAYYLTEGEHIIWTYTCNFNDIAAAIAA